MKRGMLITEGGLSIEVVDDKKGGFNHCSLRLLGAETMFLDVESIRRFANLLFVAADYVERLIRSSQ